MDDLMLPPPWAQSETSPCKDLFTADQMREYAKKAVEAEREACAALCESYRDEWFKGLGRYEFMGEGADYLADFIRARR